MDFLVTIPYLVNQYVNVRYINVILLLRISNVIKRLSTLKELADFSPNQHLLYDFAQIIFNILFLAHFVGCLFYFLATQEAASGLDNNWVDFYSVQGSFFQEYITSLYWAIITMVTIGYGDICPQTHYERLFVIFVAIIGCCYYAAIIS